MSSAAELLQRFEALSNSESPYVFEHRGDGPTVVVGCCVHGNETGSLPAALAVMEALTSGALEFPGTACFFVGNPEAARRGQRFVEDDLNRVFVPGPDSYERRRAAQLMPVLDRADVFLDLHQTILPSEHAFWIGVWRPDLEAWIRKLTGGGAGAERWVTRPPGASFAAGTCCADEYVQRQGRVGITLELGEQGVSPQATQRARSTIERLLAIAGGAALPEAMPRCMQTVHQEAFAHPGMALREGLVNFQPVAAGEVIGLGPHGVIAAPVAGALLFPKYPPRDVEGRAVEPRPSDIVHVVSELPEAPSKLWAALA